MFCKRLITVVLLWGLAVFPLSAAMISFMVIEAGLNPGAVVNEYSSLWEDGLMGVFFDAGHIVSNSPLLRMEKMPPPGFFEAGIPPEVQRDFQEAMQGGAEYFILAVLEYVNQDGKIHPREISIRVFTVDSRTEIYHNRFPAGMGANTDDEHVRAKEAAQIVAAQIKDR